MAAIVVIGIVAVDGYNVVLVVHARQEVLGIVIPHAVKENFIEDSVSNKHYCSIFLTAPPRSVAVKPFAILIWQAFINKTRVTNWLGILEKFVICSFEFVRK